MYSRERALQREIQLKQRHLDKLKNKEAKFGIDVPPWIQIEIEDLEDGIQDLENKLTFIHNAGSDDVSTDKFQYYDLPEDIRSKYQELERILGSIKVKETKAYYLGESLGDRHQQKYREETEFDEEQLKSLVKSLHVLILYTLEKILDAPSLLADYKSGYEQFGDKLTKIDVDPYLGLAYPVILDYMSPYIELIGNIVPSELEPIQYQESSQRGADQ